MQRHLYFVCPTDYLESTINHTFKQENYYWTSLGNSIVFDDDTVGGINALIEANGITAITFVLSDNNQIVLDALKDQTFCYLHGLDDFYYEIAQYGYQLKTFWQSDDLRIPVVSHYLNLKIKELQPKLGVHLEGGIKMNAMTYNRSENTFGEVNPVLFHKEHYSLN